MADIGERVGKLRKQAGISQEELSEILRISRTAVSQIENGSRKLSAEELQRLSEALQLSADDILDTARPVAYVVVEKKDAGNKVKSPPPLRVNVPRKNMKKFREVLLYILSEVGSRPNVGQTVLYKLLYFIDFDFYEKYEEQLIGATYIKNKFGPTPVEFKTLIERMIAQDDLEKIKTKHFSYPQTKYLPVRRPDLTHLKANEKEVIDNVLARLSDMSAAQISEYSHKDMPWVATEDGKPIEYESVFYRTPAYSVRTYDEDEADD